MRLGLELGSRERPGRPADHEASAGVHACAQEFRFNVMMTYVLMVTVLVIGLDLLSAWLRARIAR